MADDWKTGDSALCVDARWKNKIWPNPLEEGRTYIVASVQTEPAAMSAATGERKYGVTTLRLVGVVNPSPIVVGFDVNRFIKANPLQEDEEEEREKELCE